MSPRSDALQLFIDSAFEAFNHFAQAPQSCRSILQISSALEVPGVERRGHGSRLPVCSHLETALSIETEHEPLRRLIDRFRAVEPFSHGAGAPVATVPRARISSRAMRTR